MKNNDKNSKQLVELYHQILLSAGAAVDPKGFVSARSFAGKTTSPMTVKGQRLVLPNPEQLANLHAGHTIAFHPMSENTFRGESEVVAHLRKLLSVKLSFTLTSIMAGLLNLAASVALRKHLNPDQTEFLSMVGDVNETTVKHFTSYLLNLSKKSNQTHFASIYLKQGGVINGQAYARASILTFPAFKDFADVTDSKGSIGGVHFRVKDRAAILNLFRYVLPLINQPYGYCAGSNSQVAPFMDALMQSYGAVAGRFNDILKLFEKHIDGAKELMIDLDWVDGFEDLGSWQNAIRMIPTQAGNEGRMKLANAPGATAPAKVSEIVEAPAAVAKAPAPAAVEVVEVEAKPVEVVAAPAAAPGGYFAALASAPPMQQQPQPMYPPGYGIAPYPGMPGYPSGVYPANLYAAPAAPLVNEDGKVDFRAALAASGLNPAFVQPNLPPELQAREMQERMAAQGHQPMQYPYQGQGYYPQQPPVRATPSSMYGAPAHAPMPGTFVPTTSF